MSYERVREGFLIMIWSPAITDSRRETLSRETLATPGPQRIVGSSRSGELQPKARFRTRLTMLFHAAGALLFLLATALSAQDARPAEHGSRHCAKGISVGLNGSHGNADALGLRLGLELCARGVRRSWNVDLDLDVIKTFDEESSDDAERFEAEGEYDVHINRNWLVSMHGVAQVDHAAGLNSRVLAGPTFGYQRHGAWGSSKLLAGATYTTEAATGAGRESFPEAIVTWQLNCMIGKRVWIAEKLKTHASLEQFEDIRTDSETDLTVQITARLGVTSGIEVKWDHRPTANHDRLDITTNMRFIFYW